MLLFLHINETGKFRILSICLFIFPKVVISGYFLFSLQVQSNRDGRQYAVKRSAQRFRGNSERNRSVREARNHEHLCPHPHILNFVAAWEECGRLYIQTELCSTSLLHHAENQPPGPGLPKNSLYQLWFCIKLLHPRSCWLVFFACKQTSLLLGPTCAISSQHCSTYTLMASCIWTSSPPTSSSPPLVVWSWAISGCCLSSNGWELQGRNQRTMFRRVIPDTWPPSCCVGSMDLLQMFSGTYVIHYVQMWLIWFEISV